MKLSITPTLLNSFDWYNSCPDSWREKAYKDIEATIKRLPKEFGPEAAKGIQFEDAVQKICKKGTVDSITASAGFKEVVKRCEGGKFQTWCDYTFEHDGQRVRAYGKIDVCFPEKLIDIKTTKKYKGPLSYIKGWQPVIYMLSTDVKFFEFIIAEWKSEDSLKVANVHSASLHFQDNMAAKLVEQYDKFVGFLKKVGLYEAYLYDFCKNTR